MVSVDQISWRFLFTSYSIIIFKSIIKYILELFSIFITNSQFNSIPSNLKTFDFKIIEETYKVNIKLYIGISVYENY